MKIDKPGKSLPNPAGEGVTHAAAKNKTDLPVAQQTGSTSVKLGPAAAQIHGMANTEVVNAAKVAEIKQAISEGRFKVNSEAVADRLLATVRDLIGNKA